MVRHCLSALSVAQVAFGVARSAMLDGMARGAIASRAVALPAGLTT
jgi:hypothetical protein